MNVRLVITRDGSHSLVNDSLEESYHNLGGALSESQYVFIEKGLAACKPSSDQDLAILEVGLGTGLNVLLTAIAGPALGFQNITMTSLEPFPLPTSITEQLNYAHCLAQHDQAKTILERIHQSETGQQVQLGSNLGFTKHHVALEAHQQAGQSIDLCYYDAFAPSAQADMWVPSQLNRIFTWLRPGGLLVTYCANGQFKRDLKTVGFSVETLPGCLGKREMTRARVPH